MAHKNIARSLTLISVAIRLRNIACPWVLLPIRSLVCFPLLLSWWSFWLFWAMNKTGGNCIRPFTSLRFKKECPSALLFEDIELPWKGLVCPARPPHKKRGPFQHQICVKALGTLQCSLGIRWLSLSGLRMVHIFNRYLYFTFGNCARKFLNVPIINCNIQSYAKEYFKYSDVLETWLKSIDSWHTHIILTD